MFIQVIQGRCTRPDEMRAAVDRWHRELEPGARGWLGATYGFTDDDVFCAVVRFESGTDAMANASRPEQTRWWESVEPLFDGPAEFRDFDDVLLMLAGGSDDAGFVQVIHGRVQDTERLRSTVDRLGALLHDARPEIIGATIAIGAAGDVTQTVAFTDEAAAREGEAKEMPAELAELVDESGMSDETYLDLRHPWFGSRRTEAQSDT